MSLRIFGIYTVLEIAPVLLATSQVYGSSNAVVSGGMAHLAMPKHDLATFGAVYHDAPILPGSGLADVATNAETQALRVSLQRPDVRIILTLAEGLYRIVARRSAGISAVADLAGKRVGTMPWTSAAYYLYKELKNAGLAESDVDIRHYSPAGRLAPAMLSGEVDAIAIWEPGAQQVVEALGDECVEMQTPGLYREIFNLNTTAEHLSDADKRADIVKLVKAISVASKAITERPEIAWRAADKISGHPAGLIRSSWRHHRFVATMAPDLLDVMVEQDRWLCQETPSRTPRTPDQLSLLIDRSVFDEAAAG